MSVRIIINQSEDPHADYIGWAPCPLELYSTNESEQKILLKNNDPNQGGQVVFMHDRQGPVEDQWSMTLPADGSAVKLWIAGKFDQERQQVMASTQDKDAVIDILDAITSSKLGEKRLMVRVRKNANLLSEGERDRFLSALVQLNSPDENGVIKFLDFLNMHLQDTRLETHGRSCFLPWHRAYLLALERNLQDIDPSITIPYWKFDEPAPNLFSKDFIGRPLDSGSVDFSPSNPLINWTLQLFGVGNGRLRRNFLKISTRVDEEIIMRISDPALERAFKVSNNEAHTLGLSNEFAGFRKMEGDPHAKVHKSFLGLINYIGKAPADPLFFLVHSNVDRLWAKWQWLSGEEGSHFDPENSKSYPLQGSGNAELATALRSRGSSISREPFLGNFSMDTMWPWNGEFNTGQPEDSNPRPHSAPGGPFPSSIIVDQPGSHPRVRDMIDFQGQFDPQANLGFAYDDVPYDFNNPPFI